MLTVRMNDGAAEAVGVLAGPRWAEPPGGLAPGLVELAARGVDLRGGALIFDGHGAWAADPPGNFPDLTSWECSVSSFHLEDLVPVHVDVPEGGGQPSINENDQRVLLAHGLAFSLEISRMIRSLDRPTHVRCIVAVNETNGTFRFHQIRHGERWGVPDLGRRPMKAS